MKAKQLELFKETDFEEKHTYIKTYEDWYLFDNIRNRTDFEVRQDNKYIMVCSTKTNYVCEKDKMECSVCSSDNRAKLIGMHEYFKLATFLKCRGNVIYNKKLGKTVPKI